ncbi:hypothetical protein [Bradyrhizobium sp. CIR3A]|uniref:hypothetical protein n=1 Tax=Bradyrhizobium sp. CIR3A TaxID=2663838 RepID=UPI0016064878|nr:hypothetical protein [Bradyrhizobium sp. CIR3A]MBB4257299.1 hypothetical protein [Bradyrhizobium sp. CIR3A]
MAIQYDLTKARYDFTVTDQDGNVIDGASVKVRSEDTGQLVPLYKDKKGAQPIGNPIKTDARGAAGFFIASGFYWIEVRSGEFTKTRRYVAIGLAQGYDVVAEGLIQRVHTGAGTVTIETDDADVIIVKKAVGAPTQVELPDPSTSTIRKPRRIVDGKYDAATNNITITSRGTSKTIMGGTSYVIDSNGGSIKLTPLSDGSGWI